MRLGALRHFIMAAGVYIGSRWGWYPGPRMGFSIYGPAFVGFLGGGFGFGFGVGLRRRLVPAGIWRTVPSLVSRGLRLRESDQRSQHLIHNVKRIHSDGNFNYAYAHNTHAVTAASRSAFTGGQAINRSAAHINEASLRSAQVTNKAGFSPTRQSALGAANARGNVSRPPNSVENRSVMARTTPGLALPTVLSIR